MCSAYPQSCVVVAPKVGGHWRPVQVLPTALLEVECVDAVLRTHHHQAAVQFSVEIGERVADASRRRA